jgi:hypothetical protein
MADPLPDPEAGTPRWVKVAGIIALAVIILIVIAILTGRHEGPARHGASSSDTGTAAVRR